MFYDCGSCHQPSSFNSAGGAMQICRASTLNLSAGGCNSLSQETARTLHLLILVTRDTLQSVLRENPWDVLSFLWVSFVWAPVICPLCKQPLCSAVSVLELTSLYLLLIPREELGPPRPAGHWNCLFKKLGGKKGGKKTSEVWLNCFCAETFRSVKAWN